MRFEYLETLLYPMAIVMKLYTNLIKLIITTHPISFTALVAKCIKYHDPFTTYFLTYKFNILVISLSLIIKPSLVPNNKPIYLILPQSTGPQSPENSS